MKYCYVDNETNKIVEAYRVNGDPNQRYAEQWTFFGNVYLIGMVGPFGENDVERIRWAVEEPEGKNFAETGDWIVRFGYPCVRKFSDDEFNARFQAMTEDHFNADPQ